MGSDDHEIGVGATEELSLRVSVATLVGVLFDHPKSGRRMLALERTATVREVNGRPEVTLRASPFGGAVRITDPQVLEARIGHFHYDSIRSRQERDFRIQVRPSAWEKIKALCRGGPKGKKSEILDSSPERELTEEFEDTLKMRINREQYHLDPWGIVVEDVPVATENVRAAGISTVRVYYLSGAWIEAPEIIAAMLANHRRYSDQDLRRMAWDDFRQGGRGRANAILALALDELKDAYQALPTGRLGQPIRLRGHPLDGSVQTLLEERQRRAKAAR